MSQVLENKTEATILIFLIKGNLIKVDLNYRNRIYWDGENRDM